MGNIKKIILFVFLILVNFKIGLAQFDLTLVDYLNSPIMHNPAYVGVTDSYFFKATYSTQWVGFDGAPNTQTIDLQHHFNDEKNAVGISILNDEFGAIRNTNIEINYAFHTRISNTSQLALGIKAGLNNLAVDYNLLDIYDPTEYIYQDSGISEPIPLIGIGFYYYFDNFWLSVSVPNLIQKRIKELDEDIFRDAYRQRSHGYFGFGYNFYINRSFELKTQFLGQISRGAPIGTLFNFDLEYDQKYSFGLHIDPSSLFGFSTGIDVYDKFRLSYGYNFSFNELNKYSNGNHNIGISYYIEGSRRSAGNAANYRPGHMRDRKPYIMR